MLDQSFSAKNFREILDLENRKGNYLETNLFPTVREKTTSIQSCRNRLQALKTERSNYSSVNFAKSEEELLTEMNKLKEERELLLKETLEAASLEVTSKSFSFRLRQVTYGNNRPAFTADQVASSFFCVKQLQFNIRRLYKVKQANRHDIVCQLREILGDGFPKYIIRTDITSFYESILRSRILRKLQTDQLLTIASKRLIRRLLSEYGELTGAIVGLPRGIGVSAYLAELYMRDFDRIVKRYPGVVYYARYVDDIAVVFCPPPNQGTMGIRRTIASAINSLSLKRNRQKTSCLDLRSDSQGSVEYLGYRFKMDSNEVVLTMTPKKVNRYKKRVNLIFEAYSKESKRSEKKARRWLEKRIRFLTGNTRLVNNKKNVVSGIFFSNALLTDLSDLKKLDELLDARISAMQSDRVRRRLAYYSFLRGYEERRFNNFSANDLSMIVKVWKDAS